MVLINQYQSDGLPNITGTFTASNAVWWGGGSFGGVANGAFYNSGDAGQHNVGNGGSGCAWRNIVLNASRSSSVYGRSSEARVKNVTILPIIKY